MQRPVLWLIKTQEAVIQKRGTTDNTRCLLSHFWTHWLCWRRWSTHSDAFINFRFNQLHFLSMLLLLKFFEKTPISIVRKFPLISSLNVFQATVYSFLLVPALSFSHAVSWLYTNLSHSLNALRLRLCFARLNQNSCLMTLLAALSALNSSFLRQMSRSVHMQASRSFLLYNVSSTLCMRPFNRDRVEIRRRREKGTGVTSDLK